MNRIKQLVEQLLIGDLTAIQPIIDCLQDEGRTEQEKTFRKKVLHFHHECMRVDQQIDQQIEKEKIQIERGSLITLPNELTITPILNDEQYNDETQFAISSYWRPIEQVWTSFCRTIYMLFLVDLVNMDTALTDLYKIAAKHKLEKFNPEKI